MVDALAFREAMGRYPTGVTVVTALDADGAPVGVTVNSFTSVSLTPPLVLVCLGLTSSSHDALVATPRFRIHILADDQTDVAARFAVTPSEQRFDGLAWEGDEPDDPPRISDVAAWMSCTLDTVHRAGDHSILVGRVTAVGTSDREALVFHRGAYGVFTP